MFHLIVRGISFLAGLIYRIGMGKHLGVQLISSGMWAVLYLTLVLVIGLLFVVVTKLYCTSLRSSSELLCI